MWRKRTLTETTEMELPLTDALITSAAKAPSLAAALMEAHAAYAKLEGEHAQALEALKGVQKVAKAEMIALKQNNMLLSEALKYVLAYPRKGEQQAREALMRHGIKF